MAYSTQRSVSDGTLQLLLIEIEFFDRSEITAYFDNIPTTAYVWATDKSIRFNAPVPRGVEVLLRRSTDLAEPRHVFTDGAQFKASTLDEDFRQILHIAQEAIEGANVGDIYQTLNMHGNTISNVANAVNDGDAMNLGQVKTWSGSALNQANRAEVEANRSQQQANLSTQNAQATAQDRVLAENARTGSEAARNLAQQWAANPVDTIVQGGLYSAYHYSVYAGRSAAAAAASAVTAKNEADRGIGLAAAAEASAVRSKAEADRAKTEADKLENINEFAATLQEVTGGMPVWKASGQFGASVFLRREGVTNIQDAVRFTHLSDGRLILVDDPRGKLRFISDTEGNFYPQGNISAAGTISAEGGSVYARAQNAAANAHLWFTEPGGGAVRGIVYAAADKVLRLCGGQGPAVAISENGDMLLPRNLALSGGRYMASDGNIVSGIFSGGTLYNALGALDTPHRLTENTITTAAVGNGTVVTLPDDAFNYESFSTITSAAPGRVILTGIRELAALPIGTVFSLHMGPYGAVSATFIDGNASQRRSLRFGAFSGAGFTGMVGYKRVPYRP